MLHISVVPDLGDPTMKIGLSQPLAEFETGQAVGSTIVSEQVCFIYAVQLLFRLFGLENTAFAGYCCSSVQLVAIGVHARNKERHSICLFHRGLLAFQGNAN